MTRLADANGAAISTPRSRRSTSDLRLLLRRGQRHADDRTEAARRVNLGGDGARSNLEVDQPAASHERTPTHGHARTPALVDELALRRRALRRAAANQPDRRVHGGLGPASLAQRTPALSE